MSALTFILKGEPPERLDLGMLTPEGLAGKSRAEIEKLLIGTTRHASRAGDVFKVSGRVGEAIIFEGGSERFDRAGAGMLRGSVRVTGDVGAQAGRQMRGGSLLIEGDAGPLAGSCMRGGRIEVSGNAGDGLGGPMAGELAGMNGGILIVRGKAGDRAADRMRRGLIAVGKSCGDHAGSRMIAGTLAVLGKAGAMPGCLMRRGTILLGRMPDELSPGFVETGAPDLAFASLLDRYLMQEGITAKPLLDRAPRRFGGDNAVLGLGEILIAR